MAPSNVLQTSRLNSHLPLVRGTVAGGVSLTGNLISKCVVLFDRDI